MSEEKIGLALSGGGFRATLFHLGVIHYLQESGLLGKVSAICGVSGGAITAGHVVRCWDQFTSDDEEEAKVAAKKLIAFTALDVRNRIVRRIPFFWAYRVFTGGRIKTRTDFLKDHLERHLDLGVTLRSLPVEPELHILTTCISDGSYCSFGKRGREKTPMTPGAEVQTVPAPDFLLSRAIAISASHPVLFPMQDLDRDDLAAGPEVKRQKFTDGGVLDNLGARKLFELEGRREVGFDRLIVSDAGAPFSEHWQGRTLLMNSLRAVDILTTRIQIGECERLEMLPNPKERPIHMLSIQEKLEGPRALTKGDQAAVSRLRTDFDAFSSLEQWALERHGYDVARSELGASTSVLAN